MSSTGTNNDLTIYRELNERIPAMDSYMKHVLSLGVGAAPTASITAPSFSAGSLNQDQVKKIADALLSLGTTLPAVADSNYKTAVVAKYDTIVRKLCEALAPGGQSVTAAATAIKAAASTCSGSGCSSYKQKLSEMFAGTTVAPHMYAYAIFQYVQSKLPGGTVTTEAAASVSSTTGNVLDFHVVRMASLVIHRIVYSILSNVLIGCTEGLLTVVPSRENGLNTTVIQLADMIDQLFTRVVDNENDVQFKKFNPDEKKSLAAVYVHLKQLSLTNADMSEALADLQTKIKNRKTNIESALLAEKQIDRELFRTKIYRWLWIALFLVTVAMTIVLGAPNAHAIFYMAGGGLAGFIILWWIVQWLGIKVWPQWLL